MAKLNRRGAIQSLLGLAALAVAPGSLKALPRTDRDRLAEQIATGHVKGQTFLIEDREGLVFEGVGNFVVENCTFVWVNGLADGQDMIRIEGYGGKWTFAGCCFKPRLAASHWDNLPHQGGTYLVPLAA